MSKTYSKLSLSISADGWHSDFMPRRFLNNGHLMTLAGNFLPRHAFLPEPEELLVEVEGPIDGHSEYGPTRVLCHCHWQPLEVRSQRLTIILVHGLEGSSNSQYVLGNSTRAWAAGCNVVRMNMRSCGGTDRLSPAIYHSGCSNDVARVIEAIVSQHQIQAIALIGYSMGGNLVLKYAGELGADVPSVLKAVAGISPLMDLAASSAALHEPQNRFYERYFLRAMVDRIRRKAELFPAIYLPFYASGMLRKLSSMRMFDEHVVARFGDFADADDYYLSVASSRVASQIHVPTLILHALDDPFIRMLPETRQTLIDNLHVNFIEPQHGGHCAFLAPASGYDGYWAEKTLLGFLLSTTQHD
ncbi:YheT family hydrolase [Acidobacterium sp. S8]|uniref:YheT family hydrolase n=1 Tax=Acidobacterium sp. S8 TaxID=1641854 RepID=UPI0020B16BCD|nr:alpha/beta fold hydrolase [Acidobacterium sp. S8]